VAAFPAISVTYIHTYIHSMYNTIMKSKCINVQVIKYHSGDQVKKTEMGRTCGTYGGEERCIQGFSGET
jgi:hypothetical protein